MTRYQLAKLVSLANQGTIESRKRIQKIIFLLNSAGMSLVDDFKLHHYGPYSPEVAKLLDELSLNGILNESETPIGSGTQFNYSLTDSAKTALADLEAEAPKSIRKQQSQFNLFNDKISELFQVDDAWLLELGATIAFFHRKGKGWPEATKLACEFKRVPESAQKSQQALRLAKQIVD